MNTKRIRELTIQIQRLEDELKIEKEMALQSFRNMSEEELAMSDNKYCNDGVTIQYYPKSTTKTVDTAKMKQDGIYDNYTKETNKTDYVKVTLKVV